MEHELSGCYPIILDGSEAGQVTVSREGLFWRFEAKCEMREELLRLSVYGEGAEGYLGVMEPREDLLRLSKKLSRSGVKDFPAAISYATRAGESPPRLTYTEQSEDVPEQEACECGGETEDACAEEGAELPAEDDRPPPAKARSALRSVGAWRPCPLPCSLFSELGAKNVCAKISGALLRYEADGIVLAVPEKIALTLPQNDFLLFSDKETISGRPYCLADVKYK